MSGFVKEISIQLQKMFQLDASEYVCWEIKG